MDKLQGKRDIRAVAVEPSACPSVTKGIYTYDYGDVAGLTPLLKMFTLGHNFIPSPIHAGGLRYHGMAPLVSLLYKEGIIEAVAYPQRAVFEAGVLFAQTEGYIPAPETAHVIKFVVDEAIRCKEEGKEEVILFNGSGHGHFDMSAYDDYLAGKLEDFVYPEEKVEEAIKQLREFLKSIGREE
jgi:tryptophan synthase beta chain